MGRIKQIPVKRTGDELIEKYEEEFSVDFQHNKEKVEELSNVESKSMRNKIAGYVTKVMKKEKERREREEKKVEEE